MNDSEPAEGPKPTGDELVALDEGAAQLRRRTDPRWVEVADRTLVAALSASRPSRSVRAEAASGSVMVSDQVIVSHVRAAVDGSIPEAAVARIDVHVVGRDVFEGITVQLAVRYGVALVPLADRVRRLTETRLREVLGETSPRVQVNAVHVHVRDVVDADPQRTT